MQYRAPAEDSAYLRGFEKTSRGAKIVLNGKESREEIPDIIDIRLLMGSKDELVMPKETEFTQSDVRTLVVLPYRSREMSSLPDPRVLLHLPLQRRGPGHLQQQTRHLRQ